MQPVKPATITGYIASFPESTRKALTVVRETIRLAAPSAEEGISYGMPAFKFRGQFFIYFAGYKKHIGLYPVPAAANGFEKDYENYYTSGKGTIRFTLDKPIPRALIRKIVKFRIKELLDKEERKRLENKKLTG
jgi:uncharacterized protein YdhG (YjbR/CyaY superfamily)